MGATLYTQSKILARSPVIFASVLFSGMVLCSSCALPGLKPKARKVSLAEYVNAFVAPVPRNEPTFEYSLWVKPVIKECHPRGKFRPKDAFPAEYTQELQRALATFLSRKNRFSSVSTSGGALVLEVEWVDYRCGDSVPPRMWVGVRMKLYHLSTGVGLLVGRAESYLDIESVKKLNDPVRVAVKGGREEWIMKEGTLRLAEVSVSIMESIDEHMVNNSEFIRRRLSELVQRGRP